MSSSLFAKRYYLYSKFDQGVKIEGEGWSSVTPEPIAEHIAKRVKLLSPHESTTVLDAFAGYGSNLIQFALNCGYCTGVDID